MKTIAELAVECGVHRTTLNKAVERGAIPARKSGSILLIDEESEEFKVWLAGAESGRPRKKESRRMVALKSTLEQYLESEDFKIGVIASTKASWSGSNYKAELFPDGTWRNLWSNEIGNRYETPGALVALPTLDTEDMRQYIQDGAGDEDSYLSEVFDLNEEELQIETRSNFRA